MFHSILEVARNLFVKKYHQFAGSRPIFCPAEAENIDVSDEEVETEINSIAIASGQPLEKVRAALTKDGGERSIAHRLRNRKALDLLIANASVTEEEWSES